MKKIFILIAVFAIAFTSCKKYDLSEPLDLSVFPTVSVTGTVTGEFNSELGLTAVPSGTKLVFSVANDEYKTGTLGNSIFVTTVTSDGTYAITIPTTTDGVMVSVRSEDFIASYTETDNVIYQKKYTLSHPDFECFPNVNHKIENMEFSNQDVDPTAEDDRVVPTPNYTSTISGILEYDFKFDTANNINQTAYIPSGKVIKVEVTLKKYDTAYPTGWNPTSNNKYVEEFEITVGEEGAFEITIPMVVDGVAQVKMKGYEYFKFTDYEWSATANRYVAKVKNYRYDLDQTFYGYEVNIVGKEFKYVKGANEII